MNPENFILDRLNYLCIHGSQSYGLNTQQSDVDVKGIMIPPAEIRSHLFENFEQSLNSKVIEENYGYLKNPNNPKFESTVYSLDKFLKLASDVNPNIIELLFVDEDDVIYSDSLANKLRENRNLFLSTRAKFSLLGYSHSQFKKIERHRKWLLQGELKKPERKDYGLPDVESSQYNEVSKYIHNQIETWNFSKIEGIDDSTRHALKEQCWDLVYWLSNSKVDWGNWPDNYWSAAFDKLRSYLNLKKDVVDLIKKERQYRKDLQNYNNWLNWKRNRNPERSKLEKKAGFDLKHSLHLIRLARMGKEILRGDGVIVKRSDREELLDILRGKRSYESILNEFNQIEKEIEELYKTSSLPKRTNKEKINKLYQELLQYDN